MHINALWAEVGGAGFGSDTTTALEPGGVGPPRGSSHASVQAGIDGSSQISKLEIWLLTRKGHVGLRCSVAKVDHHPKRCRHRPLWPASAFLASRETGSEAAGRPRARLFWRCLPPPGANFFVRSAAQPAFKRYFFPRMAYAPAPGGGLIHVSVRCVWPAVVGSIG